MLEDRPPDHLDLHEGSPTGAWTHGRVMGCLLLKTFYSLVAVELCYSLDAENPDAGFINSVHESSLILHLIITAANAHRASSYMREA